MFDGQTDSEQMKKQLALFKFSLIAPVVNNCHTFNTKTEYFRDVSSKQHVLPNGKAVTFTSSAIKAWYLKYIKGGFDALVPKARADIGVSRAIKENIQDEIISLKTKYPNITGKLLYQKLIEDGVINLADVSLSSFYRFLHAHEIRTAHVNTHERKAFEMEFARGLLASRYISWSSTYC